MGPGKGQASPGNTGEGRDDSVLLLNLVYRADQPPSAYTDAELVMGAALELSCLGSQVFTVAFSVVLLECSLPSVLR